jgi:ubiquinone/menaquinone biosynthesis C-methylase UbiE
METDEEKKYFEYLTTRSKLSEWFRLNISYPYVSQYFKGKVLDVGCGIGDYLRYNKNAIGAEINQYNVDYCKSIGCSAFLIKDGILPFNDNSFDGVILDNVLEHLTDPQSVLNEISRVLNTGGILVIGVPGIKGYTMDDDHKVFYNEENMKTLMERMGYSFIKNLYTPTFIKSTFLSKMLSQYALNGVYKKN